MTASIRGKEGIFSLGIVTGLMSTALLAPGMLVFSPAAGFIVAILAIGVALTLVPLTRVFGLGFFSSLLVGSLISWGTFGEVWWKPIGRYSSEVSSARAEKQRPSKEQLAFVEAWGRGGALDTGRALSYAREIQIRCLEPALPARAGAVLPTSMELTEHPACEHLRHDAYDIQATWPDRFSLEGDDAWRWTLSASEQPSYLGGPGFLLTIRPESLLARPGPVIEVDGRSVLTIRDSANGPSRIVESPVPAMRRLRECILLVGDSLQDDVRGWRYVVMNNTRVHRKCEDIRLEHTSSVPWEGGDPVRVKYSTVRLRRGQYPPAYEISYKFIEPRVFELHASTYRRRFLLSAAGTPHVTIEDRIAATTDGPPLPCEVDPAASCD